MLNLSNVSLVTFCFGDGYQEGTLRALGRCRQAARFFNTLVFTDSPDRFPGCTCVPITERDVSVIALSVLSSHRHLFADFSLTVQWDGWIVNPDAWTDEFFHFDHIGATWPDGVVGNDGFCLRSREMWDHIADLNIPPTREACSPADVVICRDQWPGVKCYRSELERRGVRFAPPQVADRFSVENRPYSGSFGFHGTDTLVSLVKQGRI